MALEKKTRNRKAPLQEEIVRLTKEAKAKDKADGLNPHFIDAGLQAEPIPLRIDRAIRVNLNVNPQEYDRFLQVGRELGQYFKFDLDPTSGGFYKDCVGVCYKVMELVKKESDRIHADQSDLDRRREHWKFKGQTVGSDVHIKTNQDDKRGDDMPGRAAKRSEPVGGEG